MKVTTDELIAAYGVENFQAILAGQLDIGLTPKEMAILYREMGEALQAEAELEKIAQYRAWLGYDPASGVDEALCLDAFMSIYEEQRLSVIESDFPHFLKHIREEYAAVCHEQDFQDFLADYWDFCTAPEPKTMNQDMDALWDQIAAAHNRMEETVSVSYPQVEIVWVKQPPYSEMGWKSKGVKKSPLPSFEVYPWYTPDSPKYQLRM